MAFVVTHHVVAIVCLLLALIFGILTATRGGMNKEEAPKVLLIIGMVATAIATVLELILHFGETLRVNVPLSVFTLIFVLIGGIGLIVAAILLGKSSMEEMAAVASCFSALAILIYIIQWKFSAAD